MYAPLQGIIIPAATPFRPDGALDLDAFEFNMHRWTATGIRGIMCLGSNGEFRSLDDEESLAVIAAAGRCKGDKTLIVGVARESLSLTERFIDRVMALGVPIDYLSVLTPSYFASQMTDRVLCRYYTLLADHSPLPLLIYVAPKFTNGVKLSPEALAELADHPNIAGVKDTSSDMMAAYSDAAGGRADFQILAGSISNLMACLARGGQGGVVSAANYFPEGCARITDLYFGGDQLEAAAQYDRMRALIGATGGRYGTPGLKACMNLLGYHAGVPRLPLEPLDADTCREIACVLAKEGYPVEEVQP